MRHNREFLTNQVARTDGLRLVLLADTHGNHRNVRVPDGDLLIHAGDFTNFSKSKIEIVDFNTWLVELPPRYRIVTPGNHEYFLESDPANRSRLSNATVLINESAEIEGFRIWGSPITPLYGGAFGRSSAADRKRAYAEIPYGTDILITHGPPYGILDVAPNSTLHTGCRELFEVVMRIQPAVHVFGHLHQGYGVFYSAHTTFVNAALLGPHGGIDKAPIVLWLSRRAVK